MTKDREQEVKSVRLAETVLSLQTLYFVTTGVWPVAHIKSFMW